MEYHKIETLYERDPKTFKLLEPLVLKNPVYGTIREWEWTEKIDGTNIRVMWTNPLGGPQSLNIGGRTDAAQIHADLYRWLGENITVDKMREVFPDSSVVLYGEGYGAGIQKGGGEYSAEKKFILFDVFVRDAANRLGGWWLSDENVADIASKLGIRSVHRYGRMSLVAATSAVRDGIPSALALYGNGVTHEAEGLIGRPVETLYDKRGSRMIVKLKTKDFAKR